MRHTGVRRTPADVVDLQGKCGTYCPVTRLASPHGPGTVRVTTEGRGLAIEDLWEGEGPLREVIMRRCSPCERQITEHTVIVDRHTREPKQWLCNRCHTKT